jgi:hypothetical protein
MIPIRPTLFSTFYTSWGATVWAAAVYSSWFICVSCGFIETWIERQEDLEKVRRKLESP